MPYAFPLMILTLFPSPQPAQGPVLEEPLQGLVTAERNFAADTRARGIRDGFLTVLASEGVLFRPHPVNGREFFQQRPPTPTVLLWEPTFAEVSASGDLGFTTGPWSIQRDAQAEPEGWGHFVSVWIQEGGTWRLLLDLGISHDPSTQVTTPTWKGVPEAEGGGTMRALRRSERQYDKILGKDLQSAWREWVAEDGRILRDGHPPAVGESARTPLLHLSTPGIQWEQWGSGMSAAGDLGYSWGYWHSGEQTGYYLHEWRHTLDGWTLALDVSTVIPVTKG